MQAMLLPQLSDRRSAVFAAHTDSSLTYCLDVLIQKWSGDDVAIAYAALFFILFPLICLMLFFWVYVFRPITVEHLEYRCAMVRPRFIEVGRRGSRGDNTIVTLSILYFALLAGVEPSRSLHEGCEE